jgi:hypothetical protein
MWVHRQLFSKCTDEIEHKENNKMAEKVFGRCMRCSDRREIIEGKEVVTKNKMRMLKGKCIECGTVVCKMLGKAI